MGSTVQEKRIVRKFRGILYTLYIHVIPHKFCPWTDKLLLKVGRAKEMVKI